MGRKVLLALSIVAVALPLCAGAKTADAHGFGGGFGRGFYGGGAGGGGFGGRGFGLDRGVRGGLGRDSFRGYGFYRGYGGFYPGYYGCGYYTSYCYY